MFKIRFGCVLWGGVSVSTLGTKWFKVLCVSCISDFNSK
jgi:hypothetical protein